MEQQRWRERSGIRNVFREPQIGLGTIDYRCASSGRDECYLRTAGRKRETLSQTLRRMARQTRERMEPDGNREPAIRLSVYSATRIQSEQQWRQPQSSKAILESGLPWPRSLWPARPILRSQRLHCSDFGNLRKREPRFSHRASSLAVGSCVAEDNCAARKVQSTVSCGGF